MWACAAAWLFACLGLKAIGVDVYDCVFIVPLAYIMPSVRPTWSTTDFLLPTKAHGPDKNPGSMHRDAEVGRRSRWCASLFVITTARIEDQESIAIRGRAVETRLSWIRGSEGSVSPRACTAHDIWADSRPCYRSVPPRRSRRSIERGGKGLARMNWVVTRRHVVLPRGCAVGIRVVSVIETAGEGHARRPGTRTGVTTDLITHVDISNPNIVPITSIIRPAFIAADKCYFAGTASCGPRLESR
jgi:hypothetical protein